MYPLGADDGAVNNWLNWQSNEWRYTAGRSEA